MNTRPIFLLGSGGESRLCFLALTIPRSQLFTMATVYHGVSYSTFRDNSLAPSAFSLSVMLLSSLLRNSRIGLGYLLSLGRALHLKIFNLTSFGRTFVMRSNMYRNVGDEDKCVFGVTILFIMSIELK